MRKSTILTVIGAIGVMATAISTAKATPKAIELLEVAKEEKGDELTIEESVKTAFPAYAKPLAIGVGTLACIFGANALSKRDQAALASAYALLNTSYKEYKGKIREMFGLEAENRVKTEIANDHKSERKGELPEGKCLFFDFDTLQYYESTMDNVIQKVELDDGLECYIVTSPFKPLVDYM